MCECHRTRMRLKLCLRKLLSGDSVLSCNLAPNNCYIHPNKEMWTRGSFRRNENRAGARRRNNSLSFSHYSSSVNLEDWNIIAANHLCSAAFCLSPIRDLFILKFYTMCFRIHLGESHKNVTLFTPKTT